MDWHGLKLLLVEATGVSRDALHVLAGMCGQFLLALLLRRPLASPLPLGLMLCAALANELYDSTYEVDFYLPLGPEALHDLWLTMAAPTALFCIARWAPGLLVANPPARAWTARDGAQERLSGPVAQKTMAALAELNERLLRVRSETAESGRQRSRGRTVHVRGWRLDLLFLYALLGLVLLVVLAMGFLR